MKAETLSDQLKRSAASRQEARRKRLLAMNLALAEDDARRAAIGNRRRYYPGTPNMRMPGDPW